MKTTKTFNVMLAEHPTSDRVVVGTLTVEGSAVSSDVAALAQVITDAVEIARGDIGRLLDYVESATAWRYTVAEQDSDEEKAVKYSDDQPRDNAGRWTSGGSGYRRNPDGSWSDARGEPADEATVARARALGIPPGWRDVRLSLGAADDLQAVGVDAKGRTQAIYSAAHSERAAAEKFSRLREFGAELPKIRARVSRDLADPSLPHREREAAAALRLIDRTGFRVGSDAETGGSVRAYGATTLLAEHVRVEGDVVRFDFTGKHGVRIEKTLKDGAVARDLAARVARGGRLFGTTDAAVRDYLHSRGGGDFKVKDFRTWNGTAVALREVKARPAPASKAAFVRAQAAVSRVVAAHLGNTPAVARAAYIDPAVWTPWRAAALGAGKAYNSDVAKYSDDQPRDDHGRLTSVADYVEPATAWRYVLWDAA